MLREIETVNSLEEKFKKLKDAQLAQKTAEFRERLASGQTLDQILPEAFALVREAARRSIGQRHYDVQLVAALALHRGRIAEQKTGEGKTLSASPALYINALTGRGVHLVTVNDYLARRDAGWMGPIYHLLGITVSTIISDQSFIYDPEYNDESAADWRLKHLKPVTRQDAYKADITYGINSEFGFDYLRDNMVSDISQVVQRGYHFAVVDEVDSVLIDEARTPHIISAPDAQATHKYYEYARMVDKLNPETDYVIDEKLRTANLTEHGLLKLEKLMGIGNIYENDFETVHHIEAALKAKALFRNDKEYIVKDNQVVIVDEFTGRLLTGRRFSEGIHQAIEAKENVPIQQESKTLATVSLQNYFRMYEKLAGMTGTAATEAEEFKKIYDLDVMTIPTHKPVVREDLGDSVYKTTRAKYAAIVEDIAQCHKRGQPVLVGTTSIDKNEIISEYLKRKGIAHEVLNAKNHLQEAMIISQAGKKGAVTVATNMAGRGVDIVLGGAKGEAWEYKDQKEYESKSKIWETEHAQVVAAGGLHVIGTERHESRRIDNQLRGRSGRQGDPGSTRFYVSLEDDIMRLFGGEQVSKLMTVFKLPENVPLEHPMVSRAIEQAQVKVEGFHFDSRKHLVDYDDVLNKHREIVYKYRRKVLEGESQREEIISNIKAEMENSVALYMADNAENTDYDKIVQSVNSIVPFDPSSLENLRTHLKSTGSIPEATEFLCKVITDLYAAREKQLGDPLMRQIERWVSLNVIDNLWMEHLEAIDDLREGIGLRGYGQKDPLVEYKNEAYDMFDRLISAIKSEISHRIFKVQVQTAPESKPDGRQNQIQNEGILPSETKITKEARAAQTNRDRRLKSDLSSVTDKVGRNDPCPCGAINPETGKPYKYKKCGMINAPYHKG